MPQDLLTSQQAARRANVHRRTIHRWVKLEILTPHDTYDSLNGAYLFTPEQIDAAVAEVAARKAARYAA